MLNRSNPMDQKEMMQKQTQQQFSLLQKACEAGNKEACYKVRDVSFGNIQVDPAMMADGGYMEESLLAPDMDMMEEGLTTPEDPFLPFRDILGEEGYMELMEAMEMHPVVQQVAEMAMKTSDGYVEGEGGPKEDMVPARLSDGEFVFSAEAVDAIGIETLEKMHEEAKRIAASM